MKDKKVKGRYNGQTSCYFAGFLWIFTGDTHAPQGQEGPILFRCPTIPHQLRAYDVGKVGSITSNGRER